MFIINKLFKNKMNIFYLTYIINIQLYKLYITRNITELYKLMTLFYNI